MDIRACQSGNYLKSGKASTGLGGSYPPDWVATLKRIAWQVYTGLRGNFEPDSTACPRVPAVQSQRVPQDASGVVPCECDAQSAEAVHRVPAEPEDTGTDGHVNIKRAVIKERS